MHLESPAILDLAKYSMTPVSRRTEVAGVGGSAARRRVAVEQPAPRLGANEAF